MMLAILLLLHAPPAITASPRIPWTSNRILGSPYPPAPYAVERIHGGISFDHPVDLAFMPGTDELVVAEQGGRLWSFNVLTNATRPGLMGNLRSHHQPFDSILGFTFHPGFITNRYIFINYNEPGGRPDGSYISRFAVTAAATIDLSSEKVILRWFSGGHNGCTLAFGNDGYLYISTGDAADPDPPDGKLHTGQDISDLLAGILRIDVDRSEGTNAYAIPMDNPFRETPGARAEVWAFGMRNPFRMSVDKSTGDLWVGDVGWEQYEMIYRVRPAGNYGWPINEGPNWRVRPDTKQGPGSILPPLVALPHSEAASITGGLVYRGQRLPGLRGAYLYGDWETGKFWALRNDGDKLLSNDELCDTALKPVSFALDPQGELFILDYNGGLYRFITNTAAQVNQTFPQRLSHTGLFGTLKPLAPAPGTLPYRVKAPMWNDHATAEWLLGVPGDAAMATEGGAGNIAGGTWFFPSNTVLARTLSLDMKSGEPISAQRIETQVLHWDGQAWNPYSYRWRPDQSDADLVAPEGTNDSFNVVDTAAPGGRRETPWRFMSRSECLRCHNAWAGDTLTLNWLQLGLPDSDESELRRFVEAGVLRRLKSVPKKNARLANPHDPSASVAERARSWLHVNCGTCHRNGAGGDVAARFNIDESLEKSRLLDTKPLRGDFQLAAARVVASSAPFRSTLLYRISTEGAGRMPHIGSRIVDAAGVDLIRDWIQSLPATYARDPEALAQTSADNGTAAALARYLARPSPGALHRLLSNTSGALALADHLAHHPDGTNNTPLPFRAETLTAAGAHTNLFVRDLFQRFLPPDQRRRAVGDNLIPQQVLSLTGDAGRGRELFNGASQCARCHVCQGVGRPFGPELTGLAKRYTSAQLLDHILHPSKLIAPEFMSVTVTLRDDSELSGFVVKRSATDLWLRDETLTEHQMKLTDMKERRDSSLSAMPEGLLAPLTAAEVADLLAFLIAP